MPILLLAFKRDSITRRGNTESAEFRFGRYETETICSCAVSNLMMENEAWEFKILDEESHACFTSTEIPDDFDWIKTYDLHDRVICVATELANKQREEKAKIAAKVAEDVAKIKAMIEANPALAKEVQLGR